MMMIERVSALSDPNAEHDIYGCPGISDKMINDVLNADAEHDKALITPEYKAECAKAEAAVEAELSNITSIREPKGGVPCI